MFHVKHSLEETLKELQIESDDRKTSLFLQYIEELIQWNKKINLISRKLTKEEILAKLLTPSLIPCKLVENSEKVLDFGAGGGIASIPLKIFKPKTHLHLVESKTRSVVFLEHISALLNLDLKIVNKFIKKPEDLDEQYDWVFVRAVNPEKIPHGIAERILYYGKYAGDIFSLKEELSFKGNTISVLI
jgi:16S rRNA (guanine(527)-N(7))-methyltransferase RsmG